MGILIGRSSGYSALVDESGVNIELEVLDYLVLLKDAYSIQAIAELDPYGTTRISCEQCGELVSGIDQILDAAKLQKLPAPPLIVGLESSDGEEFGWEGLIHILTALRTVCHDASVSKGALVARGD